MAHSSCVELIGPVPTVDTILNGACASVVPIQFGGGTRIKILESMAYGVPVVSTTLGCEGLDLRDGLDVLIGDTPADFAAQCVRLLRNPQERLEMSRHGRTRYQESFRPKAAEASISRIMAQL